MTITAGISEQAQSPTRPGLLLDGHVASIERMPGLIQILETFAAAIDAALMPLLGSVTQARLESAHIRSLFEALSECEGEFAAVLADDALDIRAAIILNSPTSANCLSAIFTGREPPQAYLKSAATGYSDIEARLLARIGRLLAEAFEAGFARCAELSFQFAGLQRVTDRLLLGSRDLQAAVATLSVQIAGGVGKITVLLPNPLLQALRQELAIDRNPAIAHSDHRWAKQMEIGVAKTLVPISIVLEEFDMTLGDITNFHAGLVLDLLGAGLGRVRIDCGGRAMFTGTVRPGLGKYIVEVMDRETED